MIQLKAPGLVRRTWLGASLLWLAVPSFLESSSQDELHNVLWLLREAVPTKAVVAYIEAKHLRLELDAADVVALNEAGADSDLIVYLLDRSRRVGPAVEEDEAELVFESEGFRVFRSKDAAGKEVLVITNLDEDGRRMDRPPAIAAEEEPFDSGEAVQAPRGEALPEAEISPPAPLPPPKPTLPPPRSRTRVRQGKIYVGPFYQFVPSNLPGPDSPWSPVFQIVPTVLWPHGTLVYPLARLAPVYPPGFPFFHCRH